jgi:ribosomal protein S18 acetylase RimI-like enzyme
LPPFSRLWTRTACKNGGKTASKKKLVVSGKIIIQMAENQITGKLELAGYVMLGMPVTETGPFRGKVEKLLVAPEHRRKGIANGLDGKAGGGCQS